MSDRYRPLIAVVAYHLDGSRVTRWPEGGYGVPAPYLDSIRRAGARAAILAPGEDGDPRDLLEPFDGLLLVGGGDVDPARYAGDPDGHVYGVEPDRDESEIALLRAAERIAMPTLCVCRGMQVMNVAFGGSLLPHLPDVSGLLEHGVPIEGTETIHEVIPEPGSRLAAVTKAGSLECASHHHQGIDRLGDGLVVTGRSADGLVEAIERVVDDRDDPQAPWMLGVQWHPEETADRDPAQRALFDALTLLARVRGGRARGSGEGRTRPYAIEPSDPAWPARFGAEAERLRRALGDQVVRIDHVGSTAVPGLGSKPTIDIQVSVRTMIPRSHYADPLVGLGYRWGIDPWSDEHEFFGRDEDGERAFHVHVCPSGSEWERRHLAFRDWLREHPDDAAAYERLKRELARRHPRDTYTYVDAKTDFIRSIESKALAGAGR
ncbi:MAG TPA: gamma-glutamyl-gamma-aminobutyrate hydrolase family protein [Actinomycetota bacterium]|nr:gamma-glutamyl-gamma-aminobutyrate hydrolase family protein [Actinomycetota bacterium]